ncbi:Ninein-like protein [Bagarius yarrelli]|uniref:Ninein-like protein n=1 Tax=Bagarius yarrelli TaxID=175774 RepID=A0A556TNA2_BAGYA|nr:Ninein-like protein [Bagarius yarrelli]
MDEDEQNRYVTQLREEFDSCDTTGTGYLDKEELTALCQKLNLDAHLPLLLDILLGPQHYARVNFEEFKEGFVAVLSRSLDFCTSEEESSYLEPVPEEVSPKFVKGTKRYGRRSRPDKTPSVLTDDTEKDETPSTGLRRAKLRRSTSLESVESLKSDEDTGTNKETSGEKESAIQHSFQFEAQGQLKGWKSNNLESRKHSTGPSQEVTDGQVRAIWKELGVGAGGSINKQELSLVCDHIGLKDLQPEELDNLFKKLDKDQDGRVGLTEFQNGIFMHGDLPEPKAASTPARLHTQCSFSQDLEERVLRSTSPSLLSATVGQRLLTRLDDGSGCTSPECVITFWTEEGIRNSRDILQTLDFSLEERLSLADLTLALDNELLVSGNGIHQAALISYKDEIHFLHALVNQACQERDKAKTQLELTERHNLQLIREIDERHATMESLNESKIKDLEQEFRGKLSALRTETEQENEVLLQQVEKERDKLREEVEVLKACEANLQEEATTAIRENDRLEEVNCALKEKLSEVESTICKLKKDLNHVLQDKELQDRNDELNSELEILKNQGSARKTRQSRDRLSVHTWCSRRALTTESDSDDPEIKRGSSPKINKCTNKNALGSLESLVPSVSIETELAMEQLKERYEQEIQDLKIQLVTKVNFYERTIELMKQNMEIERKEISQGFKMEISELEEQKALAEKLLEQLSQTVARLEEELKIKSEAIAWGPEQERRVQREQAELEQNYAREIGNIVHRLTSEKDQLEAELKLKMDQEVLLVREELEKHISLTKAQFIEEQHSLLHQLHGERVRLQEQTEQHYREIGAWEAKVNELEQEVHKERLHMTERLGLEQAKICSSSAHERTKLEEKHQQEVQKLTESICEMQEQAELQRRADQKSLMLQRELEDKLEEMCFQLEDNTMSMKAQDALIQSLTSELHAKERDIDLKKEKEQKLLDKVSQLERKLNLEHERKLSQQKLEKNKGGALIGQVSQLEQDKKREELLAKLCQLSEEWNCMKTELQMVQNEKERIQVKFNHLSSVLVQKQTHLEEQEKELSELRENLEKTHDALKSRDEDLTQQAFELKSLEMDRDRLIEELRSQGNIVKDLQAKFQNLSEDWDQLNDIVQNLQNALCKEQGSSTHLRTLLNLEQEEKRKLLKENSSYRNLLDQLSSQIVEKETESTNLTEDLNELRLELQNKDKHVLELRNQLDAKSTEIDLLWNEVQQKMEMIQNVDCLSDEIQLLTQRLGDKETELCSLKEEADNMTTQLQQSLLNSQAEVQQVKEAFEWEKIQMKEQLLEMERLVMALETVMDPSSPHRARLDEVTSENCALKDRLTVLHQDVLSLEEEISKKRKKLEEMQREYFQIQKDQEREEVLELSARNLQLSNENAKLNSRLQTDQDAVQILNERLSQVSREQEETTIFIKQLQEINRSLEKEKLQLQASKPNDKTLLERQLKEANEELQHLTEIKSTLASLTLKKQTLQQDKENLLKEAEEKNKKMETLQEYINTIKDQAAQLHSQIYSMANEKEAHLQEMSIQQILLKQAQDKVLELETKMLECVKEREDIQLFHKMQQETAVSTLKDQLRSTQAQCQEIVDKLKDSESKLHAQELNLQNLKHENLMLRSKQSELETTKLEAKEQQLQEQVGLNTQEQLSNLHTQLAEHQEKTQQLELQLHSQAQQARTQLNLQQEQYEKVMENMQEQMDDVEIKLKALRLMLQDKVNQLKEQLSKNVKSDLLLKDLYVENAELMKALQITEQRQKSAEKKSFLLEEKVTALNKLLRKIAPASLLA